MTDLGVHLVHTHPLSAKREGLCLAGVLQEHLWILAPAGSKCALNVAPLSLFSFPLAGLFVISVTALCAFTLFILLHPVKAVDLHLEVWLGWSVACLSRPHPRHCLSSIDPHPMTHCRGHFCSQILLPPASDHLSFSRNVVLEGLEEPRVIAHSGPAHNGTLFLESLA